MPGALLARVRALDTDGWRVATRSVPVVFQGIAAAMWCIGWLLVRWPLGHRTPFGVVMAAAALLTGAASVLIGKALLADGSVRRRGCGAAIAGCGFTASAMALCYAWVIVPIMEAP